MLIVPDTHNYCSKDYHSNIMTVEVHGYLPSLLDKTPCGRQVRCGPPVLLGCCFYINAGSFCNFSELSWTEISFFYVIHLRRGRKVILNWKTPVFADKSGNTLDCSRIYKNGDTVLNNCSQIKVRAKRKPKRSNPT
jgi:hypothetical protein